MSDNKHPNIPPGKDPDPDSLSNIAVSSSGDVSSIAGSVRTSKISQRGSTTADRQIKFEKAQRCLENAALVSKRIKEHRKATAELLGKPFEDDDAGDTNSEMASVSERTGFSTATTTSTTLSVQDALNIPGISESLANTLKQKEILMERIKQYKEISKRPMVKSSPTSRRDSTIEAKIDPRKSKSQDPNVIQLQELIKDKENALSIMQVKMKAMETTIMDLQEKISEKDQIIEAKNMATSLMSDNISKKEKDALALLEDTRLQMTKMQENFIALENEWMQEKQKLQDDIKAKDKKICSLEEANSLLETARFDISVENSKLAQELEFKSKQISELEKELKRISEKKQTTSPTAADMEKGSLEIANMEQLTKKIELLENLNCQMRQTQKELESKLASVNPVTSSSPSRISPSKKSSPLPTRKGGKSAKMKSPWSNMSSESIPQEVDKKQTKIDSKAEAIIQALNKEILEKEYIISLKVDQIKELENMIKEKDAIIKDNTKADVVDAGTDAGDFGESNPDITYQQVPAELANLSNEELQQKLFETLKQISDLNNEVNQANKNMVKVKLEHKTKIKQMQKTIDHFSKVSDTNAEIVKLNVEIHRLSQRVAELEEEKGNLQLHLVDYDSGRMTESDTYKKLMEVETLAESRLNAISILETQKFDLVQELHELQRKNEEMEDRLADITQLQNEQVTTEMMSVQLEEEIDKLNTSKKELELVIENLKLDKEQLNTTITRLEHEKQETSQKLEHCLHENMELADKLEKLSAEKVSSAESIEIVESLTTQEKLELEEYNKGLSVDKLDQNKDTPPVQECSENIEKLVLESEELNRKIDLFTQERQEVMERMNKLGLANEALQQKINEMNLQTESLLGNIEVMTKEKLEMEHLNAELNKQIENLKRERMEVLKVSVDNTKAILTEDTAEIQDDKTAGDKGIKGNKSVKQLTKEILKLKNTIKEREEEIADCQMKILSLEEQQQKYSELLENNASYEQKIKNLSEENETIKQKLGVSQPRKNKEIDDHLVELQEKNATLEQEIISLRHEYKITINLRDGKIQELENMLSEYEKQIHNYSGIIQQKDKELSEYINQVTKLNEVSQKLKSTIELLEEEKMKDQNAELIKSLNKQISAYQKKLSECEEKLKMFEEEKNLLVHTRDTLENKNKALEQELFALEETLTANQVLIKEFETQRKKQDEEMSVISKQAKERDEEIHEIKLQLRKESIENEKLRDQILEKDKVIDGYIQELTDLREKIDKTSLQSDEASNQFTALETKNKELMEKLKKFAANLKKKNAMYAELEAQYHEMQTRDEKKNYDIEQFNIQLEALPHIKEKLNYAEGELNRILSLKAQIEQEKNSEIAQLLQNIKILEEKLVSANAEIENMRRYINSAQSEVKAVNNENENLRFRVEDLNKKLAMLEMEQKNYTNIVTKIAGLEQELQQKQNYVNDLLNQIHGQEQVIAQMQGGQDAKLQERDLYIESLETEIAKYKSRICRLEESISNMEDRRQSIERKADQLDSQLQEKQKAYSDYSNQEDELVGRLAALMNHDRVVEKQLHEIEKENIDLHSKIQNIYDDNQALKRSLTEMQEKYYAAKEKADQSDITETELANCQQKLREMETCLKKLTHEHQTMLIKNKKEIEDIEIEFNSQIENTLKEKKSISEKYEKLNDHVILLEKSANEYKTNIQNLTANLDEVTRLYNSLTEEAAVEKSPMPDYTEQYINEINRLNAVVNYKNQEIEKTIKDINTVKSNLGSQIFQLNEKIKQNATDIDKLGSENTILKQTNAELQHILGQRDEQIQMMAEKKKVTFEMNIPKTEGLLISSTIEPVEEVLQSGSNQSAIVSSIEAQILSQDQIDANKSKPQVVSPTMTAQASVGVEVVEPVIVPKTSFLCYKGDEEVTPDESDPFNSEEGWGFGETSTGGDEIMPGFTRLTSQITQLQKENDNLKKDLAASNTKLMKALKKLKELKATNEMLSGELKISKQLSESTFLDNAMEDELKNNIRELEKRIEELSKDLNHVKKDKEALAKQNEVFKNANDRLTDIKEKQDNELELWKYKFKQANDKLETVQWEGDAIHRRRDSVEKTKGTNDARLTEDIVKLEKENEELASLCEQLTLKNNDLTIIQTKATEEIKSLKNQLLETQTTNQNTFALNNQIIDLQNSNSTLQNNLDELNKKLAETNASYESISQKYCALKAEYENILTKNKDELREINEKCEYFESETKVLQLKLKDSLEQFDTLKMEHDAIKLSLSEKSAKVNESEIFAIMEKYQSLETNCHTLQHNLDINNTKLADLESENSDLKKKNLTYETEINNCVKDIQNLKQENFDLNERIIALGKELEVQVALVRSLENEKELLLAAIEEFKSVRSEQNNLSVDEQIVSYKQLIQEQTTKIQQLNSENDQLLSTVAELRSSVASVVDQRGFEIAELWKQHLAQREAEFQKIEVELRTQLAAAENKYEALLDNVQSSSQEETNNLVMMEQLAAIQNKLQDKESHVLELQNKYADALSQLDILRSDIDDEKLMLENKLLTQQEEYEKTIDEIKTENTLLLSNTKQTQEELKNDLAICKENNVEITMKNNELASRVAELQEKVNNLSQELQMKNVEIHQKSHDLSITLAQRNEEFDNVRKQLLDYEKKIEDLSYENEAELAVLRLKMHESQEDFDKIKDNFISEKASITKELNSKILECTALNKQITDLNAALEEHSVKAAEMQSALENQELEIVTLKDEIEHLNSSFKASASKIEKHVTFSSDTKSSQEDSDESINKELLDPVPRAELDLALYMLHQRDVRCEELTMELTQLLEERDTLQLRLSDSLRSQEELKLRCQAAGLDLSVSSQEGVELPTYSVEREQAFVDTHRRHSSRSSSVTETDGDKLKLNAKLSELRGVRQSRDVRLLADSSARELDMRLLQRDVAHLPPEAVERLQQAHHTLSRDSQSTPTVLLNWLRGKTSPKVVHM